MLTEQLTRKTEAAEEVGNYSISHDWFLILSDSAHRPNGEVTHGSQEVSIPSLVLREVSCHVDGDTLERRPDVIIVHQAPDLFSGISTRCASVTLLVTSLDAAP